MPDDRLRSTIFESMAFLCRSSGADVQGEWLEGDSQSNVQPVVRVVGDEVFSEFSTVGLRVEGRHLNCSVLEKCYTVTNSTGAEMQTVALTHYMDGDLFFRAGNLSTISAPPVTGLRKLCGNSKRATSVSMGNLRHSSACMPWAAVTNSCNRGRLALFPTRRTASVVNVIFLEMAAPT